MPATVVATGGGGDTLNTTGANLIVVINSAWPSSPTTFGDNKGNTYTPLTAQGITSYYGRMFYCENPTVGTGHTFSGSGSFVKVSIIAFANAGVFESEGGFAVVGSTIQPGVITPSEPDCIVVAGVAFEPTSLVGIDGGFTVANTQPNSGGVGCSLAYLIQTAAAAANPTWTMAGSANLAAPIAVFKGPPPPPPPVVVGTVSNARTTSGASSLTMAHPSTGDPLYVCASLSDPTKEYGSVTYAGMSLSRLARVTGSSFSHEWWFLANPPAGTANVVCTILTSTEWMSVAARNVSGVDLDGVARNLTTAFATNTAPSVTLASTVSDLVLDFLSQNANSQVYTPGAGQTQDWAQSLTGNDHYTAGSQEVGALSVTMSWGLSISTPWLYSAISIPAAGLIGATETRVTLVPIEVLSQPILPEARVTQHVLEVIGGAVAEVWISQTTVEILTIPPVPARVSQMAVEILNFPISMGRISQVAVEVLLRVPSESSDLIGPWMGDGMGSVWIE